MASPTSGMSSKSYCQFLRRLEIYDQELRRRLISSKQCVRSRHDWTDSNVRELASRVAVWRGYDMNDRNYSTTINLAFHRRYCRYLHHHLAHRGYSLHLFVPRRASRIAHQIVLILANKAKHPLHPPLVLCRLFKSCENCHHELPVIHTNTHVR
jgi:hypothetical protein